MVPAATKTRESSWARTPPGRGKRPTIMEGASRAITGDDSFLWGWGQSVIVCTFPVSGEVHTVTLAGVGLASVGAHGNGELAMARHVNRIGGATVSRCGFADYRGPNL